MVFCSVVFVSRPPCEIGTIGHDLLNTGPLVAQTNSMTRPGLSFPHITVRFLPMPMLPLVLLALLATPVPVAALAFRGGKRESRTPREGSKESKRHQVQLLAPEPKPPTATVSLPSPRSGPIMAQKMGSAPAVALSPMYARTDVRTYSTEMRGRRERGMMRVS